MICIINIILLLTSKVIFDRCLEVSSPQKEEGLILCSLLLPKPNQDLLLYLMELLQGVVKEEKNLMTSHNLSIVLAPNMLPLNIESYGTYGKSHIPSEDIILVSNIDIIQVINISYLAEAVSPAL